MAKFENVETGEQIILRNYHVFGRRTDSGVHTAINDAAVSRIHALVQWDGKRWIISDLNSRNGCWLNGEKLISTQTYPLRTSNLIRFGGPAKTAWRIVCVSPPRPHLLPLGQNSNAIELENIFALKDESETYFRKTHNNDWFLEVGGNSRLLSDGQLIELNGEKWCFVNTPAGEETEHINYEPFFLENSKFVLDVSQDEESVRLSVKLGDNKVDLGERSHFYLIYLLATTLQEHSRQQFDKRSAGWLYTEQLCRMLKVSESHLNIMIFRIRKQFSNELTGIADIARCIERKTGKIRLGLTADNILVNKPGWRTE